MPFRTTRAAPPLRHSGNPPSYPAEPARELPGGLHLHFHGVLAEDIAAILASQQKTGKA